VITSRIRRDRYDVVIAGARCAGASTAMLLARRSLRVLVVDPLPRGSDTLSTHALMRAGVLQLHRWGLLDRVRAAGTPAIRTTTFHYGDEAIRLPIKDRDGLDSLYAPRRTVLDAILVDAATESGAEVQHGLALVGLLKDGHGRVRGATLADGDRRTVEVAAELVVGADGVRSKVARLAEAPLDYSVPHAAASVYGYWRGLPADGNHWYYREGASVGTIPTNDGDTCVFAVMPRERFEGSRAEGMDGLHRDTLATVSAELAAGVASAEPTSRLRGFPGLPGFLRRATGPGWALVGDAGYFRDPITAHGITDALCDAELLARAVIEGGAQAMAGYQERRDDRVRSLLDVTDRIASFRWSLDEIRDLHLTLSRDMNAEVEAMLSLDGRQPTTAPRV